MLKEELSLCPTSSCHPLTRGCPAGAAAAGDQAAAGPGGGGGRSGAADGGNKGKHQESGGGSPGQGLRVASGSITPRVWNTGTGRGGTGDEALGMQCWGWGAEDALPPWPPLWGPAVTGLAVLSPPPHGCPLSP